MLRLLLARCPQCCCSTHAVAAALILLCFAAHRHTLYILHTLSPPQEYLGSYVSDASGRLVFREGPLVQAVRHGWWVVLDELNLAPTEVLEALNRCVRAPACNRVWLATS